MVLISTTLITPHSLCAGPASAEMPGVVQRTAEKNADLQMPEHQTLLFLADMSPEDMADLELVDAQDLLDGVSSAQQVREEPK
jgi:hypothetical protein